MLFLPFAKSLECDSDLDVDQFYNLDSDSNSVLIWCLADTCQIVRYTAAPLQTTTSGFTTTQYKHKHNKQTNKHKLNKFTSKYNKHSNTSSSFQYKQNNNKRRHTDDSGWCDSSEVDTRLESTKQEVYLCMNIGTICGKAEGV